MKSQKNSPYERLLLGRVGELSSVWAIATPDGDVYVED